MCKFLLRVKIWISIQMYMCIVTSQQLSHNSTRNALTTTYLINTCVLNDQRSSTPIARDSMSFHAKTALEGYIPSLCNESPTHLAVIAAAISGTMYCRPPVSSNMITTNDTSRTHHDVGKDHHHHRHIIISHHHMTVRCLVCPAHYALKL